MLSARLIQLIEDHSEEITRTLLQKVRHDPLLPRYRELSDFELLDRFRKVCNKLGYWLADSDPEQVATAYEGLGRDRFNEQIPLHEVVHAAHLIKNQLTGYARRHCLEQTAVELYAEGELERLINGFFDKVVFHLIRGYEAALVEAIKRAK